MPRALVSLRYASDLREQIEHAAFELGIEVAGVTSTEPLARDEASSLKG